jgi:hypothetical protein
MLDSNRPDPDQLVWLEGALRASRATWKIAVFHHPLYSSARTHGSTVELRPLFEPLFALYGVDVVLSGHDHVYQRVTPQHGIQYFVVGGGGDVRVGDLDRSDPLVAAGDDTEGSFLLVDADASRLRYRAINERGERVDKGRIDS